MFVKYYYYRNKVEQEAAKIVRNEKYKKKWDKHIVEGFIPDTYITMYIVTVLFYIVFNIILYIFPSSNPYALGICVFCVNELPLGWSIMSSIYVNRRMFTKPLYYYEIQSMNILLCIISICIVYYNWRPLYQLGISAIGLILNYIRVVKTT
jgi:hypothetical protein